jgi:hypothetical protein
MLIYDLVDPQELQGFVRTVLDEQQRNRFVLSQFLPNLNINDIEYRVVQGQQQDEDAAFVRAWDAESPIGKRQGLTRLMGSLPPISKKIRLGEEERLRLLALQRGNNQQIIDAIFNDAAKMARAIAARFEMLRGEALAEGSITLNENGVSQDVDFGRSSTHDVAPSTLWSNHAGAVPIQDEQGWLETYTGDNNSNPAVALTDTKTVNHLLLNAQYRSMAASNGITPAFLSLAGLNQIRSTFDLPPIVKYDVKVRVNGVQQRVIPEGTFLYLPGPGEGLGRTLFGTTAESLELVGANQISQDQAPGMVAVVEKTFDPVATWTKAAAVGFPAIPNPDLTMKATVV